jgi:DNA-binding GntR family transcriptional regulator
MKKLKIPCNLTTLAYDSIKQAIMEGRFDEDSRLTEDFLSSQLGISKSPVREALNRLEAEGLVRIEPRRGAYVRRFSTKEVKDLYDLREELEVYAVRIAKLTPRLFAELAVSIENSRHLLETNEKQKYIDEDVRFHGAIANATGNAQLCRVLENVQNQIWLCRCSTYNLSSSVAAEFHQRIVDALQENDRKQAETAMRLHISHVRQRLLDFLEHPISEMEISQAS